ncbi:MAG: PAS domain-containing protein [Actinomycetota bacterium]|nr:PAS domain-containing protein [Actinomycetota bacterium]
MTIQDLPVVADCVPAAWLPDHHAGAFRSFFERSGVCVAWLDRVQRIENANDEFVRRLGRHGRDVRGRELREFLHTDDAARVSRRLGELSADPGGRVSERVSSAPYRGGSVRGELTGVAVADRTGTTEGVIVLVELDDAEPDSPFSAARRQPLSELDARILEGVGAGVSTMQLAATLYLSRGGVEYHVKSLLRRFKVKNRPALISKAYSTGVFRMGLWPPRVSAEHVR